MNLIYAAPVHDCHVWNVGGGERGPRTRTPSSKIYLRTRSTELVSYVDFRVNLVDVKLEIDAIRAMEEEEEGKKGKKNVMNRRNRFLSRRGRCLFLFFFSIILNLYVTRFIVARSEI